MKSGTISGLIFLGLTSCVAPPSDKGADARPEIASYCARKPIRFSEKLDLTSPRDSAISKKFKPVCEELSRQNGLDFGRAVIVYECRAYLPRDTYAEAVARAKNPPKDVPRERVEEYLKNMEGILKENEKRLKKLQSVFGENFSLASFHEAGSEPDDIAEEEYQKTKDKTPDPQSGKGMPLAYFATYMGVSVEIIILSDETGNEHSRIFTREELSVALKGVNTLAGGADLLHLRKLTGITVRSNANTEEPEEGNVDYGNPICTAKSIDADRDGWTVKGATIYQDCRPTILRDFRIDRDGKTTVINTTRISETMGLCID